jgi:hypothetical protein
MTDTYCNVGSNRDKKIPWTKPKIKAERTPGTTIHNYIILSCQQQQRCGLSSCISQPLLPWFSAIVVVSSMRFHLVLEVVQQETMQLRIFI